MFSKGEIVTYNNEQSVITEIIPGFAKINPIIYNSSKKAYFVRFDSYEHLIPFDKLQKFNVELNFKDMVKKQEQELKYINNKIADHTKSLCILKNDIKYSNAINNYFTKLSNNLPDMKEYCDIAIGLSEHKYKYYNLYSDYNGRISSLLHNIDDMLDETHLKQLAILKKDGNLFEVVLYTYSGNSGGYSKIKFFETEKDCIESTQTHLIDLYQNNRIDDIIYIFRGDMEKHKRKVFDNLPKEIKNGILTYELNNRLERLKKSISEDSNKVISLQNEINKIIGK